MKKMMKKFLMVMLFVAPIIAMVACEKDIKDDDDLISGKWREASVVNDENATYDQLHSYVEYSPYNYSYDKRTVNDVVCKTTDGEESGTTVQEYSVNTGHYTINGDTLTIVNSNNVTKLYTIKKVEKDTMVYVDNRNKIYTYYRYKN